MNQDLELIPPETKKVYNLIKDYIRRRKLYTGGCRTFYTPLEWKYRKEEFCTDALLIMVYDGSEVKHLVHNIYTTNGHNTADTFRRYLDKHGYYLEQGTHWYCGIYKKPE